MGSREPGQPFLSAWWKRMAAVLQVSLDPGNQHWVPDIIQSVATQLSDICVLWENRFDALDRCKRSVQTPNRRLCAEVNMGQSANGTEQEVMNFCDVYSRGTGLCRLRDGSVELDNCGALRPHVFQGQGVRPQLFCPGAVPVAVLPVLKSGSIMLRTWLLSLETVELRRATEKFIHLWRTSGGHGLEVRDDHLDARINHYVEAQKSLGDSFLVFLLESPEMLGRANDFALFKFIARTLSHVVGDHLSPFSKVALPPQICRTCCVRGVGRLPLMIARNPFSRVESIYRKFVILRGASNSSAIAKRLSVMRFSQFINSLQRIFREHDVYDSVVNAAMRSDHGLSRSFTKSYQELPYFLPFQVDTMEHLLPVADLWWRGPGNFSQRQGFILHLESIDDDLKAASTLLCQRWGHCDDLPKLPHHTAVEVDAKKSSMSWKSRLDRVKWTEDLRSKVATIYAKDFELLGYDPLRPARKAPIRSPGGWNPGGQPWIFE